MAQGTGYIYNQRGDVVLGNRTGTTRNQPSSYKPFKLLKGVDTTITFFIRDVNGCKVQLHEKSIKAQITKHDSHAVLVQKNLRITDYENGVATLHLTPGDIANLDAAFYNILLTYTSNDNKITALHVDQNYRYCYVAEVVDDCGPMHMHAQSFYSNYALGLETDPYGNPLGMSPKYIGAPSLPSGPSAGMPGMGGDGGTPTPLIYPIGVGSNDWTISVTLTLDQDITYFDLDGLCGCAGCNAVFNVSTGPSYLVNGFLRYSITFTNPGVGYNPGDQITVTGDRIGGVRGDNDLTITIDTVDPAGRILTYTPTGTPHGVIYTIVTNRFEGPATSTANCGGINTFSITYGGGTTGTIQLQATLNSNPTTDRDWFNVPDVCGYNQEIRVRNRTGCEAYAVDGMFMYIRFKFTLTSGRVDKIHYRR